MRVELIKEFRVEAAHETARGLHGHSYRIEVIAEGEVEPVAGWLIDYGDIKRAFEPLRARLDHGYLNAISELPDTSLASLRAWILRELSAALPCIKDVRVTTAGSGAFSPQVLAADPVRRLGQRIRFSFEAAQSLPNLPEAHPCQRLHGHTYQVEVAAEDLDALRAPLRDLYETLDHRYLNEIPGLDAATSERLCQWIWQRLERVGLAPTAVVIQETATARCVYRGQ